MYLSRLRILPKWPCVRTYGASNVSEKQTHFGYQTVYEHEKQEKVHEVFENVAGSYDKMNDLMSFGIHRYWKHRLIRMLDPPPGTHLLDVAGGSGDVAFRFLDYLKDSPGGGVKNAAVTVCDINRAMLKVGQERAKNTPYEGDIRWICGNAEDIPLESDSVSAYTISFGIRNVTHIDKVLGEAYRVLKPGGRFLCLEFSRVDNEVLRMIYDRYSFEVIPVMGLVIAGDWNAYQYLVESIRKFPDQETFKGMIEKSGFSCVNYENLTFGVVSIHSGYKL